MSYRRTCILHKAITRHVASDALGWPDLGQPPCACERKPPFTYPSTTRLQIVQRSLSGGFLIEDAALLNANVRSMFGEAGNQGRLGRPRPLTTARRAAPCSQEEHRSRLEAGCELLEVA